MTDLERLQTKWRRCERLESSVSSKLSGCLYVACGSALLLQLRVDRCESRLAEIHVGSSCIIVDFEVFRRMNDAATEKSNQPSVEEKTIYFDSLEDVRTSCDGDCIDQDVLFMILRSVGAIIVSSDK